MILELFRQLQIEGNNLESFISSLQLIYSADLSWLDSKTLKRSLSSLKNKRATLLKNLSKPNGKTNLDSFLGTAYSLPEHSHTREGLNKVSEDQQKATCINVECPCSCIIEELRSELRDKNSQLKDSKAKLMNVYSLIGKVGCPKHVLQTLKRKECSTLLWKKKYSKLRKECQTEKLTRRLKQHKDKVKLIRAEKKQILRKHKVHAVHNGKDMHKNSGRPMNTSTTSKTN